jgi:hypothetical protein
MVLIWGPSSKGGDLYNKRVQILNRLRELGHAAFFSEEIDSENPLQDIPLHIREAHQAQLSDLIVLLHAPYGSAGELHDFVHIPAIRSKLLVFVDEKRVTGYSYQGALTILQKEYNSVVTYKSPEDITECRLLGAVVEKIQLHRHTKYWQGLYSSQGEQKR